MAAAQAYYRNQYAPQPQKPPVVGPQPLRNPIKPGAGQRRPQPQPGDTVGGYRIPTPYVAPQAVETEKSRILASLEQRNRRAGPQVDIETMVDPAKLNHYAAQSVAQRLHQQNQSARYRSLQQLQAEKQAQEAERLKWVNARRDAEAQFPRPAQKPYGPPAPYNGWQDIQQRVGDFGSAVSGGMADIYNRSRQFAHMTPADIADQIKNGPPAYQTDYVAKDAPFWNTVANYLPQQFGGNTGEDIRDWLYNRDAYNHRQQALNTPWQQTTPEQRSLLRGVGESVNPLGLAAASLAQGSAMSPRIANSVIGQIGTAADNFMDLPFEAALAGARQAPKLLQRATAATNQAMLNSPFSMMRPELGIRMTRPEMLTWNRSRNQQAAQELQRILSGEPLQRQLAPDQLYSPEKTVARPPDMPEVLRNPNTSKGPRTNPLTEWRNTFLAEQPVPAGYETRVTNPGPINPALQSSFLGPDGNPYIGTEIEARGGAGRPPVSPRMQPPIPDQPGWEGHWEGEKWVPRSTPVDPRVQGPNQDVRTPYTPQGVPEKFRYTEPVAPRNTARTYNQPGVLPENDPSLTRVTPREQRYLEATNQAGRSVRENVQDLMRASEESPTATYTGDVVDKSFEAERGVRETIDNLPVGERYLQPLRQRLEAAGLTVDPQGVQTDTTELQVIRSSPASRELAPFAQAYNAVLDAAGVVPGAQRQGSGAAWDYFPEYVLSEINSMLAVPKELGNSITLRQDAKRMLTGLVEWMETTGRYQDPTDYTRNQLSTAEGSYPRQRAGDVQGRMTESQSRSALRGVSDVDAARARVEDDLFGEGDRDLAFYSRLADRIQTLYDDIEVRTMMSRVDPANAEASQLLSRDLREDEDTAAQNAWETAMNPEGGLEQTPREGGYEEARGMQDQWAPEQRAADAYLTRAIEDGRLSPKVRQWIYAEPDQVLVYPDQVDQLGGSDAAWESVDRITELVKAQEALIKAGLLDRTVGNQQYYAVFKDIVKFERMVEVGTKRNADWLSNAVDQLDVAQHQAHDLFFRPDAYGTRSQVTGDQAFMAAKNIVANLQRTLRRVVPPAQTRSRDVSGERFDTAIENAYNGTQALDQKALRPAPNRGLPNDTPILTGKGERVASRNSVLEARKAEGRKPGLVDFRPLIDPLTRKNAYLKPRWAQPTIVKGVTNPGPYMERAISDLKQLDAKIAKAKAEGKQRDELVEQRKTKLEELAMVDVLSRDGDGLRHMRAMVDAYKQQYRDLYPQREHTPDMDFTRGRFSDGELKELVGASDETLSQLVQAETETGRLPKLIGQLYDKSVKEAQVRQGADVNPYPGLLERLGQVIAATPEQNGVHLLQRLPDETLVKLRNHLSARADLMKPVGENMTLRAAQRERLYNQRIASYDAVAFIDSIDGPGRTRQVKDDTKLQGRNAAVGESWPPHIQEMEQAIPDPDAHKTVKQAETARKISNTKLGTGKPVDAKVREAAQQLYQQQREVLVERLPSGFVQELDAIAPKMQNSGATPELLAEKSSASLVAGLQRKNPIDLGNGWKMDPNRARPRGMEVEPGMVIGGTLPSDGRSGPVSRSTTNPPVASRNRSNPPSGNTPPPGHSNPGGTQGRHIELSTGEVIPWNVWDQMGPTAQKQSLQGLGGILRMSDGTEVLLDPDGKPVAPEKIRLSDFFVNAGMDKLDALTIAVDYKGDEAVSLLDAASQALQPRRVRDYMQSQQVSEIEARRDLLQAVIDGTGKKHEVALGQNPDEQRRARDQERRDQFNTTQAQRFRANVVDALTRANYDADFINDLIGHPQAHFLNHKEVEAYASDPDKLLDYLAGIEQNGLNATPPKVYDPSLTDIFKRPEIANKTAVDAERLNIARRGEARSIANDAAQAAYKDGDERVTRLRGLERYNSSINDWEPVPVSAQLRAILRSPQALARYAVRVGIGVAGAVGTWLAYQHLKATLAGQVIQRRTNEINTTGDAKHWLGGYQDLMEEDGLTPEEIANHSDTIYDLLTSQIGSDGQVDLKAGINKADAYIQDILKAHTGPTKSEKREQEARAKQSEYNARDIMDTMGGQYDKYEPLADEQEVLRRYKSGGKPSVQAYMNELQKGSKPTSPVLQQVRKDTLELQKMEDEANNGNAPYGYDKVAFENWQDWAREQGIPQLREGQAQFNRWWIDAIAKANGYDPYALATANGLDYAELEALSGTAYTFAAAEALYAPLHGNPVSATIKRLNPVQGGNSNPSPRIGGNTPEPNKGGGTGKPKGSTPSAEPPKLVPQAEKAGGAGKGSTPTRPVHVDGSPKSFPDPVTGEWVYIDASGVKRKSAQPASFKGGGGGRGGNGPVASSNSAANRTPRPAQSPVSSARLRAPEYDGDMTVDSTTGDLLVARGGQWQLPVPIKEQGRSGGATDGQGRRVNQPPVRYKGETWYDPFTGEKMVWDGTKEVLAARPAFLNEQRPQRQPRDPNGPPMDDESLIRKHPTNGWERWIDPDNEGPLPLGWYGDMAGEAETGGGSWRGGSGGGGGGGSFSGGGSRSPAGTSVRSWTDIDTDSRTILGRVLAGSISWTDSTVQALLARYGLTPQKVLDLWGQGSSFTAFPRLPSRSSYS